MTYLRVAFAHLEDHELHGLPLTPPIPDGAALGLCDGATARRLFYDTVDAVIIPRLEGHGLAARWAWSTRRAPGARSVGAQPG